MFVRTERLTLRPGWSEDAPALAAAIGHERVVRHMSSAPWPCTVADAHVMIERRFTVPGPHFLIFAHDGGRCDLIGSAGIGPFGDEPHNLGYWITPGAWGRGYATEAAGAVLRLAAAIGIGRVSAGHHIDNPASGAVLRRLGFVTTGVRRSFFSAGRGAVVESVEYAIDLHRTAERSPAAAG